MEKNNTKQQILDAALDLFSRYGYDATGISQIADAVGIRKASLYSHFTGKQEILDTLLAALTEEYNAHSLFANADWDSPAFTADRQNPSVEDVCRMVKGQVRYILHDGQISKVRKLLTIEQFRNSALNALHTKQFYEDVLRYNLGLVRYLIRQGSLRGEDPEIMAAQLAWPVSVWASLCDREPEREQEVMDLLERHIQQFFRAYGTQG